MRKLSAAAAALSVFIAVPALAGEAVPGLLYNMGGKFDKSFNEAAYNGAESFKAASAASIIWNSSPPPRHSANRPCATWPGAAPTSSWR